MNRRCPNNKTLFIITEHFYPSTGATAQLVTQLANHLHSEGHKIQVVTATSSNLRLEYPIIRLLSNSHLKVSALGKTLDGIAFFTLTLFWLIYNLDPRHSLLIVSNPPFIGLIGVVLSFVKRTKYIFLLQDVFPRSAVLTGLLPAKGPTVQFWKTLMRLVINNSADTIVLSSAMAKRCTKDFLTTREFVEIPNWSVLNKQVPRREYNPLNSEWNLNNYFVVQYSGNFGRMHDILTILETARLLKSSPTKFLFIGDGPKMSQIAAYKSRYNLDNVITKPFQPLNLLHLSLGVADVSVVSLIPGSEDTISPSKLYGILASSKPVLLISNPDTSLARLINRHECGVVVPPGDVSMLFHSLERLRLHPSLVEEMSLRSLELYQRYYLASKSLTAYEATLKIHNMI